MDRRAALPAVSHSHRMPERRGAGDGVAGIRPGARRLDDPRAPHQDAPPAPHTALPPAVEVLDRARDSDRLTCADGALVFPSRRGVLLPDLSLSRLTQRQDCATPHGFRSSFRTWCSETGVPFEVAEAALGHRERSAVVRAYARSDHLDARRGVMEAWAAYIAG